MNRECHWTLGGDMPLLLSWSIFSHIAQTHPRLTKLVNLMSWNELDSTDTLWYFVEDGFVDCWEDSLTAIIDKSMGNSYKSSILCEQVNLGFFFNKHSDDVNESFNEETVAVLSFTIWLIVRVFTANYGTWGKMKYTTSAARIFGRVTNRVSGWFIELSGASSCVWLHISLVKSEYTPILKHQINLLGTGWPIWSVKSSCWLAFGWFCHPTWALGSYSGGPLADGTVQVNTCVTQYLPLVTYEKTFSPARPMKRHDMTHAYTASTSYLRTMLP